MASLRTALFNIVFYVNLVVFLVVGSPLFLAPRAWAMWALKLWATVSLWWLKVIVGLRLEVRGLDHVPKGAALIAAKHQSLFETFAVLPLLRDPAMVLKRELLWIPLFGWFAVKFRMIPVDRAAGARALKTLIGRAQKAARAGRQILIFPEGTRRPPGAAADYRPGAAALYLNTGVSCVPMALNSGLYWPRRSFRLSPGTIIFQFLPAIPPGLARADFSVRLENALETASAALLAEAGRKGVDGEGLPMNAINVIAPYKHHGMWVFDDTRVGLVQEPFVAGADTMIDRVAADIPDAEHGFTLIFSSTPFPGHQYRLDWRRAEAGGNWYYAAQLDMEAWLCPALFKYFQEAPKELHVQTKNRLTG